MTGLLVVRIKGLSVGIIIIEGSLDGQVLSSQAWGQSLTLSTWSAIDECIGDKCLCPWLHYPWRGHLWDRGLLAGGWAEDWLIPSRRQIAQSVYVTSITCLPCCTYICLPVCSHASHQVHMSRANSAFFCSLSLHKLLTTYPPALHLGCVLSLLGLAFDQQTPSSLSRCSSNITFSVKPFHQFLQTVDCSPFWVGTQSLALALICWWVCLFQMDVSSYRAGPWLDLVGTEQVINMYRRN